MAVPLALANLETAILDGCAREEDWPAAIAAGICAGIDFAIAHPELAETLAVDAARRPGGVEEEESVTDRLTGFLRMKAPRDTKLPPTTDEALVAGMVGLVSDHLRVGRLDRLKELRPEFVLLTLLPYLGFAEAQKWANQVAK